MKKVVCSCICILFLSLSSVVGSSMQFFDMRTLSMGFAGIAFSDYGTSLHNNPASLYRRDDSLLRTSFQYREHIRTSTNPLDPIPSLQEPATSLEVLFSNRYIALSLGIEYALTQRTIVDNALRYDAINSSLLQLTASYGWEYLSFGVFARGGNQLYREDIHIRKEYALTDYLTQTFLDRYYRGPNGQFFSTGFGVLLSYQWVSLGLLTNNLFSMNYQTNELTFNVAQLYEGLSVGIAFSSPQFNEQNELHRLVYNVAFDVAQVGSSTEREVRMGAEIKIQLLQSLWIAVRGGYREKRDAQDSLFGLDGSGNMTLGLGVRMGNVLGGFVAEIPAELLYSYHSDTKILIRGGVSLEM